MSPDHPKPCHGCVPKVRLGASPSCDSKSPSSVRNTVLSRDYNALLLAKVELLSTARNCECLLEAFKRLPVPQDLLCMFALQGDGGDGIGSVLSPQKCLVKTVKLRKEERSSLSAAAERHHPGSCVHHEPLHESVTEMGHSLPCIHSA
jgi:hypothetical protein